MPEQSEMKRLEEIEAYRAFRDGIQREVTKLELALLQRKARALDDLATKNVRIERCDGWVKIHITGNPAHLPLLEAIEAMREGGE
jgi:hypothetical protein